MMTKLNSRNCLILVCACIIIGSSSRYALASATASAGNLDFLNPGKILSNLNILSGLKKSGKKKVNTRNRSIYTAGSADNDTAGFLGIGSLLDPIIILKRRPKDSPVPEMECLRTRFMSPFLDPQYFVGNGSIMTRRNPVCTWNLIGTEACIPLVNCPTFSLENQNETCTEYMEITDGNRGYAKFCGNDAPTNISAADGLRDLFVTFKSTRWEGPPNPDLANIKKFNCTVSCSGQGDGKPLPIVKQPNVNPMCKCGRKWNQDYIINGTDATKGEFPWLASLVETNTRQPFCGGSLVNDRFILTAAHCIKGMFMNIANVEVVLNGQIMDQLPNSNVHVDKIPPIYYDAATLARYDSGNKSIRFPVEEIIVHPLYVSETNDFDVALLRLPKTVAFADDAHKLIPTCLPKLGSYLRTYSKSTALIAGWGLTEPEGRFTSPILKKLEVNVIPPNKCKIMYAHRINRRMLCAGFVGGGRDSCMGDSGGPLVYQERPQVWYQIGTVSWGEGCASKSNPGVYIRTTESGQWVHYHSNRHDAVWCSVPP